MTYDSVRKCWRKFCHKFHGITVPDTTCIPEHTDKVRFTASLPDKKPRVIAEGDTDDIRARLTTHHINLWVALHKKMASRSRQQPKGRNSKFQTFYMVETAYACMCRNSILDISFEKRYVDIVLINRYLTRIVSCAARRWVTEFLSEILKLRITMSTAALFYPAGCH